MKEVKLKIEGMHCEGCVNRIKNSLGRVEGVKVKDVSLEKKEAIIEVSDNEALENAKNRVIDLDFGVEVSDSYSEKN